MRYKTLTQRDELALFGFLSHDRFLEWMKACAPKQSRRRKRGVCVFLNPQRRRCCLRDVGLLFVFVDQGRVVNARLLTNEVAERVIGRYPFHRNSVVALDVHTDEGRMSQIWLELFHGVAAQIGKPSDQAKRMILGDSWRWDGAVADSFLENRFYARGLLLEPVHKRRRVRSLAGAAKTRAKAKS